MNLQFISFLIGTSLQLCVTIKLLRHNVFFSQPTYLFNQSFFLKLCQREMVTIDYNITDHNSLIRRFTVSFISGIYVQWNIISKTSYSPFDTQIECVSLKLSRFFILLLEHRGSNKCFLYIWGKCFCQANFFVVDTKCSLCHYIDQV